MNWIPIDPNNLPSDEVLATNGLDFIVGYLYFDEDNEIFIADTEETSLWNVCAYCVLEPYKKEIPAPVLEEPTYSWVETRIVNGEEFTFKGTPVPYEGPKHKTSE